MWLINCCVLAVRWRGFERGKEFGLDTCIFRDNYGNTYKIIYYYLNMGQLITAAPMCSNFSVIGSRSRLRWLTAAAITGFKIVACALRYFRHYCLFRRVIFG